MAAGRPILAGLLLLASIACCYAEGIPQIAGARHLAETGSFDPKKVLAFCTGATPSNINAVMANSSATNIAVTNLLALFDLTPSDRPQLSSTGLQALLADAYSMCVVVNCYGSFATLPNAVLTACPPRIVLVLEQAGAAASGIVSGSSVTPDYDFPLATADIHALCGTSDCRNALNVTFQAAAQCLKVKTDGVNVTGLSALASDLFTANLTTASSCEASLQQSASHVGSGDSGDSSSTPGATTASVGITTPVPTTPAATKSSSTTTSSGATMAVNVALVAMGWAVVAGATLV